MKAGIKRHMLWFIVLACILSNQVMAESITLGGTQLKYISIKKAALYPESLKYNPKTNKFLVGSFRDGGVYEIDQDGHYQRFINDKRLISTLGIWVDEQRNRLLAVSGDLGSSIKAYPKGIKKLAALGIYDLSTGKALHFVNLGDLLPQDPHLANGLTIDSTGNAYVTDSFAPVIYKINVKGEASIFLQSDRFKGKGINLNGIVFHPDGYLIAAMKSTGILFKIPLTEPDSFSEIKLGKKLFGSDGVTLLNNNNLLIVANRASGVNNEKAFIIKSDDHWQTAALVDEYPLGNVYPTTGVVRQGKIYVLHSSLNVLVKAKKENKNNLTQRATIQQIGTIE